LFKKEFYVKLLSSLANSHTDPIFKNFEILTLSQINVEQIIEFMRRYSYNALLVVFSNFFSTTVLSFTPTILGLPIQLSMHLHILVLVRFPLETSQTTWNLLPKDIRYVPTLSLFKEKLHSLFIEFTHYK